MVSRTERSPGTAGGPCEALPGHVARRLHLDGRAPRREIAGHGFEPWIYGL